MRTVLALTAAVGSLLSVTPASRAAATTINVVNAPYNANPSCGADATSAIQNALNYAATSTPSTVLLGGSCFLTSETLNVAAGVTLAGQGQTATTLRSRQSSGPILHLTGSDPGLQSFKIDGSSQTQDTHTEWGAWLDHTTGATVQQMEIWQTRDSAVMIAGGSGNTVTNVLLHGMGWNEPTPQNVDDAAGVYVSGAAMNTTVSNSTLRNMNRQWIHCLVANPKNQFDAAAQWNGLSVSGNTFTNCGLRGYLGGGAITAISGSNATFTGNDISNSPDSQLWTYATSYTTIQSNKFYNTDGQNPPGVEASGSLSNLKFIGNNCNLQDRCLWMYTNTGTVNSAVTINGNTATNSTSGTHQSYHVSDVTGGTVQGNVADNGCVSGLYMTNDANLDVEYNTATGCSTVAVLLQDSSGMKIQNNYYDNNVWPGGGVELGGTVNNTTVTCNDLSNDGFTVWNFSSGPDQTLSPNNGVCSTSSITATATPTAPAAATATITATATPTRTSPRKPHPTPKP